MSNGQQLDRPHQNLDALRIQAEIETADKSTNKRPTWAPAVVLEGELLECCHELGYLAPEDKPVARLWAIFADPKRKGTAVRSTFSRHPLSGIRCRGFEMRAGMQHNGDRLTRALMDADGSWKIGCNIQWAHSDISRMRERVNRYELNIEDIRRSLQPSEPPQIRTAEEIYQQAIKWGDGEEQARRFAEFAQAKDAEQLARWQEREHKKQDLGLFLSNVELQLLDPSSCSITPHLRKGRTS